MLCIYCQKDISSARRDIVKLHYLNVTYNVLIIEILIVNHVIINIESFAIIYHFFTILSV